MGANAPAASSRMCFERHQGNQPRIWSRRHEDTKTRRRSCSWRLMLLINATPVKAVRAACALTAYLATAFQVDPCDQKNFREMLNPRDQFLFFVIVSIVPPRAICAIVVPNASEKFNWNR